jgi:hypothetical protein
VLSSDNSRPPTGALNRFLRGREPGGSCRRSNGSDAIRHALRLRLPGLDARTCPAGGFRLPLHRYEYLAGLRGTGSIAPHNRSVASSGCPGSARGTVSFGRNDVTATINGRRLVTPGR